jgi:mannose-6-phosphate isomerase-like protein (cupin superfamily)
MDELGKAVEMALQGSGAEKALADQDRQMREWGITLPRVQALVLDFGLGQFDQIGETEHWIANEVEEGYCGKFLFVRHGQTCPTHYHKEKHETFFIVKGSVRMVLDGVERRLDEGDVLVVGPGESHCFTGIGPALILEVSKPCLLSDNYFDDPRIPVGRACEGARFHAAHGSEPMRGTSRQNRAASDARSQGESAGGSP